MGINSISKDFELGQWTTGNAIHVSGSAKETTQWKLDFIKSAKKSIEISGSICGGKVFREALQAMAERMEKVKKLKVTLVTTPDLLEREDIALLNKMAKVFPQQFEYLNASSYYNSKKYKVETHRKTLIIDEKYYIVGGTNFQDRLTKEASAKEKPNLFSWDTLLGSGSSDMDFIGRGHMLAKSLRIDFFELFTELKTYQNGLKSPSKSRGYFPLTSKGKKASIKKFDLHPHVVENVEVKATAGRWDTEKNGCIQEYKRLIKAADKSLTIAHMYFDPPKEVDRVLSSKALKVPVTVLTSGVKSSVPLSNQFFAYANQNYCKKLLKTSDKVNVYTYNNGNNIFHMKVLVSKGSKGSQVFVGSSNLGGKSHQDYELGLTVRNEAIANRVMSVVKRNLQNSEKFVLKPSSGFFEKIQRRLTTIWGIVQSCLFPYIVG